MVADFCTKFCKKVGYEDIVAWVKKIKSLKGIIGSFYKGDKSIFQYCDQLEMVATRFEWYIEPCLKKNGAGIKQLEIGGCSLDTFMEDAEYFPNLERLFIFHSEDWPAGYYTNGAILSRLKIVGLSLNTYSDYIYHGFKFINSCPNLQSAHIRLYSNHIFVDESMKHESLQDLVLQFYSDDFCWNQLKELLKKYPNLKHLALREFISLENETVLQLVNILPNLVLFDARGCIKVTQEAASYVQDYNRLHGRLIKFYFDGNYREIHSDWPQLSTKWEIISQGFDFMKHCFLKDFYDLPTFLIPSED
ncbi:uncharacterized protein LOC107371749 [Tetranychus urticae]|nr:uncharacterized protein LOC107371749 [Tetranychus urticae]